MENIKEKKGKIEVSVDDTKESVLKLMEKLDIVELIYPPEVFFPLPKKALDKLTRDSLVKYTVARQCAAAEKRTEKLKSKPGYQKIEFGEGGSIAGKMKVPKDNDKFHFAVLNEDDMRAAIEQGYVPAEETMEKSRIQNFNKRAKIDEVMFKMKVPIEQYKEHIKAVSDESKYRVRNRKIEKGKSNIEYKRDAIKSGISQYGNPSDTANLDDELLSEE